MHVAARITPNETLHRAADAYDRAARVPYGRTPRPSPQGRSLRTTAWLLAAAGRSGHDYGLRLCGLVARLADLTVAVGPVRCSWRSERSPELYWPADGAVASCVFVVLSRVSCPGQPCGGVSARHNRGGLATITRWQPRRRHA